MGVEDLLANRDSVAVIEYHQRDTYTVPACDTRVNYYQIIYLPTAIFGGTLSSVDGSHSTSLYPDYLPLYQQQMAQHSPFEMFLFGSNSGTHYSVDVNIHKLVQFVNTRTVLQAALTESHIPCVWQNQDSLQYVLRLMVPDEYGTPVDMTGDDFRNIHLDFSISPFWISDNLEISTFIQDTVTREIYNGYKIWLKDLVVNGTDKQSKVSSSGMGNIYPDPFDSYTIIPVFNTREGQAEINVYSVPGQKVRTLFRGMMNSGKHNLSWNGTDDSGNQLPDGIYYVLMTMEGKTYSQKIIIQRGY